MKAAFSAGAHRDVKNILEYYAREADAEVAMDFHAELRALIDKIKQWPESFPLVRETSAAG